MVTSAVPPFSRAPYGFALALLLALVAFYPSYFARLAQTDAAHHFHGITGTAWMLLLVAQSWLMRQRRVAAHRQLGRLALVVAPLFVLSGLLMMRTMLASEGEFERAFGSRLACVDLVSVSTFALAVALALHHRRVRALHARWMASTVILLLPPALARLMPALPLGIASFEQAFHAAMVVTEAVILGLLYRDWRELGRPSRPFLVILVATLVAHAGFVLVPQWPAWQAFAAWYGGR